MINKTYPKKSKGQLVGWKKLVIIPPQLVKKDSKRLDVLK